jgi:hypothetical protein
MRQTLALAFGTAIIFSGTFATVALAQHEENVVICHVPPGNPSAAHTITVGAKALRLM